MVVVSVVVVGVAVVVVGIFFCCCWHFPLLPPILSEKKKSIVKPFMRSWAQLAQNTSYQFYRNVDGEEASERFEGGFYELLRSTIHNSHFRFRNIFRQ